MVRLAHKETGADATEYALPIAGVVVAFFGLAGSFGVALLEAFNRIAGRLPT